MTAAAGPTPRGDVAALAARVRELATKAATLEEQDDRAALYGELLSTCAGCHALVRPAPVPGP
jgi:mono/diheme cytochrome c family protein